MSLYLQDSDLTVLHGDALTELKSLPDGSVHCCVTSPPYWGLRDYGTGAWDGGDADCDHRVGGQVQDTKAPGAITTGQRPGVDSTRCRKCGATRVDRQLGLEATPEEYVNRMVEVFREVRRVLRDDGTLWLNLGDSYANPAGSGSYGATSSVSEGSRHRAYEKRESMRKPLAGLKPKDLVGIPWRVAFALQQDGWWLRSDIVWSKPNPMPESVTDRPTKSHEYVFLLTKSARYFFDADAVREPHAPDGRAVTTRTVGNGSHGNYQEFGHDEGRERWPNGGRNIRSVWEITTQPYPDAHFAVFPEELARRCILAGSPEGGTVLDPFAGSGTTGLVARNHGRRAVLIELSETYCALIARRTQQLSVLA